MDFFKTYFDNNFTYRLEYKITFYLSQILMRICNISNNLREYFISKSNCSYLRIDKQIKMYSMFIFLYTKITVVLEFRSGKICYSLHSAWLNIFIRLSITLFIQLNDSLPNCVNVQHEDALHSCSSIPPCLQTEVFRNLMHT